MRKNDFFNYVCDNLAVKILTGKSFPSIDKKGIYCTPVTSYSGERVRKGEKATVPYPSSAISHRDPLSYSHFRHVIVERHLKIGDFIYTSIDRVRKYIWFIAARDVKYMYNLERLELCIQNLADNRAHDEGTLYIPLLGRYKEDRVSPTDFADLVLKYLSDGKFDVILVEDY
tara:strand:- start:3755 stop:4270 length:516 start_codon:yes stop_codon:yes gene_type:complete